MAIADIAQRPQKPPGWFTWFKGDPPETDAVAQKVLLPACMHIRCVLTFTLCLDGCVHSHLHSPTEPFCSCKAACHGRLRS